MALRALRFSQLNDLIRSSKVITNVPFKSFSLVLRCNENLALKPKQIYYANIRQKYDKKSKDNFKDEAQVRYKSYINRQLISPKFYV